MLVSVAGAIDLGRWWNMERCLIDMEPGEEGIIVSIKGDGAIRRRLMDMGVIRGARIEVVRRAPLGDPVEFVVKGYNLALRKDEAACVYVEV